MFLDKYHCHCLHTHVCVISYCFHGATVSSCHGMTASLQQQHYPIRVICERFLGFVSSRQLGRLPLDTEDYYGNGSRSVITSMLRSKSYVHMVYEYKEWLLCADRKPVKRLKPTRREWTEVPLSKDMVDKL